MIQHYQSSKFNHWFFDFENGFRLLRGKYCVQIYAHEIMSTKYWIVFRQCDSHVLIDRMLYLTSVFVNSSSFCCFNVQFLSFSLLISFVCVFGTYLLYDDVIVFFSMMIIALIFCFTMIWFKILPFLKADYNHFTLSSQIWICILLFFGFVSCLKLKRRRSCERIH